MKTLTLSDIEVGTKVKIVDKLTECKHSLVPEMFEYQGKETTIQRISGEDCYELGIDGGAWNWCSKTFTILQPTTPLRDLAIKRSSNDKVNEEVVSLIESLGESIFPSTSFLYGSSSGSSYFFYMSSEKKWGGGMNIGKRKAISASQFLAQYAPKTGKEAAPKKEKASDSFEIGDRVEVTEDSAFLSQGYQGKITKIVSSYMAKVDGWSVCISRLKKLPTVPEVKEELSGTDTYSEFSATKPLTIDDLKQFTKAAHEDLLTPTFNWGIQVTNSPPRGGKEYMFKKGDRVRAKSFTPYSITDDGWEGVVTEIYSDSTMEVRGPDRNGDMKPYDVSCEYFEKISKPSKSGSTIKSFPKKVMSFLKGLLDPDKQLLIEHDVISDDGVDFDSEFLSRAFLSQEKGETLFQATLREVKAQDAKDKKKK